MTVGAQPRREKANTKRIRQLPIVPDLRTFNGTLLTPQPALGNGNNVIIPTIREERMLPPLHCFLVLLGLMVLEPTGTLNAQRKWREVLRPEAGFRIQFPGEPKIDLKKLPSKIGDVPVLLSIFSDDSGKEFLAMYTGFPPKTFAADAQIELDRLHDENIRAVGGSLGRRNYADCPKWSATLPSDLRHSGGGGRSPDVLHFMISLARLASH